MRDVVGIRVWVWVKECEQGGGGGLGGEGTIWGLNLAGSVIRSKTVGSAGHC